MIWLLILVAKIAALPFLADYARLKMDDRARGDAPGKFIKLRRGITHYRRFGPQEGPLVVCVHGLTTPSFVFEGIAEAYVKNGYRVLVYDHYGIFDGGLDCVSLWR
jgi:pimeloyl-ACP methyl ester carboxylesterase